ncbi:MAG: flavin reductase, partial [Thermodesulfobacteriota bacterium]|nr:flavin reductase [Thermodesulfobacteriota bacterium]
TPAPQVHPLMEEVMEEKGLDVAFRNPKTIDEAARSGLPELIITMGTEEAPTHFPGVPTRTWDLPDPSGQSTEFMRKMRRMIENSLEKLIPEWLV